MKMIAGACLRASANRRRMRAAPRPANISTNEDADCEKNCAPDSCATALASSVLPVPGGPCSSTPLGTFAPRRLKRFGSRRNSTTSCSSSLASSTPAMSVPADLEVRLRLDLDRLGPRHHLQRAPQHEDDRRHEDDGRGRSPTARRSPGCARDAAARPRPGPERLVQRLRERGERVDDVVVRCSSARGHRSGIGRFSRNFTLDPQDLVQGRAADLQLLVVGSRVPSTRCSSWPGSAQGFRGPRAARGARSRRTPRRPPRSTPATARHHGPGVDARPPS